MTARPSSNTCTCRAQPPWNTAHAQSPYRGEAVQGTCSNDERHSGRSDDFDRLYESVLLEWQVHPDRKCRHFPCDGSSNSPNGSSRMRRAGGSAAPANPPAAPSAAPAACRLLAASRITQPPAHRSALRQAARIPEPPVSAIRVPRRHLASRDLMTNRFCEHPRVSSVSSDMGPTPPRRWQPMQASNRIGATSRLNVGAAPRTCVAAGHWAGRRRSAAPAQHTRTQSLDFKAWPRPRETRPPPPFAAPSRAKTPTRRRP